MPPAAPPYALLAIDLDGTLLCSKGKVSDENRRAIADARDAGITVTVCTGRGLAESQHINRQIGQTDPVVVAGGAILACPIDQRTLHRFTMDPADVRDLVEAFNAEGHAALVLKDPDATGERGTDAARGHDYLIVSPRGPDGIDPISRWWFRHLGIGTKVVPSLDHDPHPEATVRVGLCGPRRRTQPVAHAVESSFAGRLTFHHFGAVVPPGTPGDPGEEVLIFEAFGPDVNKWTAIRWLADRRGIDPARIAAIGNDVNDVAMLRGAGLAVAMGNAIDSCRAAAHRHTLANDDHGVAHAIRNILDGAW